MTTPGQPKKSDKPDKSDGKGNTQADAKKPSPSTDTGSNATNAVNQFAVGTANMIDGGYGQKFAQSFKAGDYGDAALNFGASMVATGISAFTFGESAAVTNFTNSIVQKFVGPSAGKATTGLGEIAADAAAQSLTKLATPTRYGPYHRVGDSPTAIKSIQESGELLGNPARNYMASPFPKVKAYGGPLPIGRQGFEFYTHVAPDIGHVPGQPVWMAPRAGVAERNGQAVIQCSVVRINC
jgi:hypothetical protein